MSIDIVTFGCRLNIQESDVMRRHAQNAGLADAAIVNTCAVTGEAVAKARQAIRRLARAEPDRRIIVTGCAAQTDPEMFAAMPEVSRVIGNDDKLRANTWIAASAGPQPITASDKIAVSDIMQVKHTTAQLASDAAQHTRAFVQVQNGCDHRCTFCIIPFGRGSARSAPADDVVMQVRGLAERGVAEVVLTGVDLTSYGHDLPDTPTLGMLVKRLLREAPEIARLRLSSIDSIEADRDLIDALASEPRLMPHLHLSLQAGDDLILKRMKRRHARADAIAFCKMVRQLRPDIVFGADIIVGFPTESEDMFARSLDLVDDCGLTHLHVFPFSPRPGTPAARMPQVANDVVQERARALRVKGTGALQRHLDGEIGARRRVLTERGGVGRTEQFTQVRIANPLPAGVLCDVVIADHDGQRLIAA